MVRKLADSALVRRETLRKKNLVCLAVKTDGPPLNTTPIPMQVVDDEGGDGERKTPAFPTPTGSQSWKPQLLLCNRSSPEMLQRTLSSALRIMRHLLGRIWFDFLIKIGSKRCIIMSNLGGKEEGKGDEVKSRKAMLPYVERPVSNLNEGSAQELPGHYEAVCVRVVVVIRHPASVSLSALVSSVSRIEKRVPYLLHPRNEQEIDHMKVRTLGSEPQ